MWNKIGKLSRLFLRKLYFRSGRSTLVYCGCFVRVQIDFTQIEAKQKKERKRGKQKIQLQEGIFLIKKKNDNCSFQPLFLSFANSIIQNPM